jgi:DNA-binding MarR family transcriptional regulator
VAARPSDSRQTAARDLWRLMLECSMAHVARSSGILQRLGLTPGHMRVLMELHEGEGRPMGALAQSFGCDASTMTWLVDRLEERGLVERQAFPADRRVKAVALTPLGAKTAEELRQRLHQPPAELLALHSTMLEELREVLGKVHAGLHQRAADDDGGPAGRSSPQRREPSAGARSTSSARRRRSTAG